jgi:hypothetical protein
MNLQQWIEKHPVVFLAIIPIYLLFLWLLVGNHQGTLGFMRGKR